MSKPASHVSFGVFVDTLDEEYQERVFEGLCDEATTLGVNLLCFVGGMLQETSRRGRDENAVYRLGDPQQLRGLVVLSGTLSNYAAPGSLETLCRPYREGVVCSIGGPLAGAIVLEVDARAGLRRAVQHLVQTAGRRRIAFIRGPEANAQANERFRIFEELCREYRLPLDRELTCDGDYFEDSGRAAIANLLDLRRQGFDAVLASSDLMALGAIAELSARGVAVPERVAVVGFDDILRARFSVPSLSTIRQPLREQGRRALQEVVARLTEPNLPPTVLLEATFVARQSCGGHGLWFSLAGVTNPSAAGQGSPGHTFQAAYQKAMPTLLRQIEILLREAGVVHDPSIPERLLVQACVDIQGMPGGLLQRRGFVRSIEECVLCVDPGQGEIGVWQEIISTLRNQLNPCLQNDPKWRSAADDLWHEARARLGLLGERSQAARWLREVEQSRALRRASSALLRAVDLQQVAQGLALALRTLGIHRCWVVANGEGPRRARLLVEGDQCQALDETDSSQPLLPERWLNAPQKAAWVILPLIVDGPCFGHVVLEKGPAEGRVYAALRDCLAATLARRLCL